MDVEGTDGIWCSGIFQDEDLGQSAWVSLGSSSVQSISHFDYGHHQTHFHFVKSSFQFFRVVFVLLSPVFSLGSLFLVSC